MTLIKQEFYIFIKTREKLRDQFNRVICLLTFWQTAMSYENIKTCEVEDFEFNISKMLNKMSNRFKKRFV